MTVVFIVVDTTLTVVGFRNEVVFARESCTCSLFKRVAAAGRYESAGLPPGIRLV